ncbi:hypothetical protein SRHO_G00076660 [Serrasalmus rhombeus]
MLSRQLRTAVWPVSVGCAVMALPGSTLSNLEHPWTPQKPSSKLAEEIGQVRCKTPQVLRVDYLLTCIQSDRVTLQITQDLKHTQSRPHGLTAQSL